jgi:hypothetical protein
MVQQDPFILEARDLHPLSDEFLSSVGKISENIAQNGISIGKSRAKYARRLRAAGRSKRQLMFKYTVKNYPDFFLTTE